MNNYNISQAHTLAIRLVKFVRNLLAERQIILEDRLCRFIANSDINGECRKLGCIAMCKMISSQQADYSNPIVPLQKINPPFMVKFISQATYNDISTFSQETFDIAQKIDFIQTPVMVTRILEYARRFGIGTHLSDAYEPENEDLIPVAAELDYPHSVCMETIIFHGAGNTPEFLLGKIIFGEMQLFVPIRFYRQCSTDMILAMLELPNGGQKMPLYNAEKIEANPHCTVILSDEMAIAFCNDSNAKMVYSTWYGGMELVEKIDWELLRGHKVQWLIFDEARNVIPADKYRKAAKVAELCAAREIDIEFRVFDHVEWTEPRSSSPHEQWGECTAKERVLSLNDFIFEAGELGVHTEIKSKTLRCYSDHELRSLPERPYIIDPILKPGHYCLIYGGTGVAKTWFTLAMALGISRGESFIDYWGYEGKARKVLYVAGEMEPEMFGERLQKLSSLESKNFLLVRENLNLVDSADQERLLDTIAERGSQVVILDNLTTLAERGAYENGFGKLLALINRLKESGIAVVLVHHENKAGEFKGTTKIKDVAEMSLHLVKASGKGINLYIKADKIRGKADEQATAFKVSFDPNYPNSKWHTSELSDSERRVFGEDDPLGSDIEITAKKTKRKAMSWHYMDDDSKAIAIIADTLAGEKVEITAANHTIPTQAVEEFADEFDLTDENIHKHLDSAMEKAKSKAGDNVTPYILAPCLWEQIKSAKKCNRMFDDIW